MVKLEKTYHCTLCCHHKTKANDDIICGLTNISPAFHKTCSKIQIHNTALDLIIEIDKELKKLESIKLNVFLGAFFSFIIGLAICFWAYLFYLNYVDDYKNDSFYILNDYLGDRLFVISLFSLSSVFIFKALAAPIKFIKSLKTHRKDKVIIDKVLRLYHLKYLITYYPKSWLGDKRIMVKDAKIINDTKR